MRSTADQLNRKSTGPRVSGGGGGGEASDEDKQTLDRTDHWPVTLCVCIVVSRDASTATAATSDAGAAAHCSWPEAGQVVACPASCTKWATTARELGQDLVRASCGRRSTLPSLARLARSLMSSGHWPWLMSHGCAPKSTQANHNWPARRQPSRVESLVFNALQNSQ